MSQQHVAGYLHGIGLAQEHVDTLLGALPSWLNFAALWKMIQDNKPAAILFIQTVLPLLPPGGKLAIALQALLAILQPAG